MLKQLLKRPARFVWHKTAGIRGRLKARMKSFLTASMAQALEQHAAAHTPSTETALAIEDILTELYRLQIKIDQLEQAITERDASFVKLAG